MASIVNKIIQKKKEEVYEITVANVLDGFQVVDIIPSRLKLLILDGESIKLDQLLTNNPNVNGFGQGNVSMCSSINTYKMVQ